MDGGTIFGVTLTNSAGRIVPVRLIGEQHVTEDLGNIPSFADWVKCVVPAPWMGRTGKLDLPDDLPAPDEGPVS